MWKEGLTAVGAVFLIFEILGIASAVRAVLTARTSQGAIAWAIALITWPVVSVPLYWVFGRSKFRGYQNVRKQRDLKLLGIADELAPRIEPYHADMSAYSGNARVLEELVRLPFTNGNDTQLLVDGPATFAAIFAAIDNAQEYVLAQFFIVHDDLLGRELKDRLIRQARQGRQVYFLYDDVGSNKMTSGYLRDLTDAGVHTSGIRTTKGWGNRFQLNFRNHRKTVVIDGHTAFVGGHNVGDEYMGRHARLSPWRDTHMKIEGPAALATQLAFAEDWHWATDSPLEVSWTPRPAADGNRIVFVLPSGPADEFETCGLFFTHSINLARQRIWIASPYFVPDEGIITALQLAAMRGVDVRILIPGLADKWFIKLAAMSYVESVSEAGVKMYEFAPGFMHKKVVVIDDLVSTIGTANFDNRSFRLNFEMSVLTIDREFNQQVSRMLEEDFAGSKLIDPAEIARRPLAFKVGCRIARLFSPVL